MASVRPGVPRYTIQDDFATLRITVPTRRNWVLMLFLGVWLTGWAAGEIIVGALFVRGILALLRGQTPDIGVGAGLLFMGIWLTFWTVGGGFALVTWLWNLAGKEIITLDGNALTIRKAVWGVGPAKRYDFAYVDRLRVSADSQGPWAEGLAFDYGADMIRFGRGLSPAEAHEVWTRIADRFPTLTRGLE